jgi:signal transduction histidine kinase/ActR/RegA family two-component response regulator
LQTVGALCRKNKAANSRLCPLFAGAPRRIYYNRNRDPNREAAIKRGAKWPLSRRRVGLPKNLPTGEYSLACFYRGGRNGMENWWDIWGRLFDTTGFVPRWQCGAWSAELVRMHRISDFLIWLAYLTIPIVLVSFAAKRRAELPFRSVFLLFALFILSCGTTHLIDALMFDYPLYRLSGVVKLITAAASWGTVLALIPIVPKALQMKSPEVLQREVNERERAESEARVLNSELQALNAQLEERVRQRTLELEKLNARLEDVNRGLEQANAEKDELLQREQVARAEAEDANRAKDEFLATLSHELRTPMNAMMGWIALLGSGRLEEEMQREAIATIERNTRVQAQLIEDILDVSRIITGKLSLEMGETPVAPVIDSALAAVLPAAQAKGVELRFDHGDKSALVWGDPNRLQQVMWNLLSNAIKFTPKGGHVEVALWRVDSLVKITVRDSGEGIAPDVLPHVFERFWQADSSSTRRHGGMGLGLAIVRHLVELHGGAISAHSEGVGHGSTFTVTLPLRALQNGSENGAPEAVASTRLQHPLQGASILVVDDEPDARSVVAMSLKIHGAQVRTAASVAEAVELFRQWRPDVLVSDIGMPDEDGFALMEQIRTLSAEQGGDTPAIALTAYASSDDRTRVLTAGFSMHFPKPADPDELAAAVAGLLGRS